MTTATALELSVILGAPGTDKQAFRIASKDPVTPITIALTNPVGGEVIPAVTLTERIAEEVGVKPYTGTDTAWVTGLTAGRQYTYTVTQGVHVIGGSFSTFTTEKSSFSFFVTTCERSWSFHPTGTYARMRQVIEEYKNTAPVICRFHPDDWGYVDAFTIPAGLDPEYSGGSGGNPQDTHDPEDYALGWAYHYGLYQTSGKWLDDDTLWVYRNIPMLITGGDHAVASNYCRGHDNDPGVSEDASGIGVCWRDPRADPNQSGGYDPTGEWERAAFDELKAWCTDGNSQAGELYCGLAMPGVNVFMMESLQDSVPYNIRDPSETIDQPFYSSTQINEFFDLVNSNDNDFSIPMMVAAASTYWEGRWPNEANAWKASCDANPKLNGTDGHLVVMYGDNHNMHCNSMDTFYAFCAGMVDSTCVGQGASSQAWGGVRLFSHGRSPGGFETGEMLKGGFLHVIYEAGADPKLTVNFYDGGLDELTSF